MEITNLNGDLNVLRFYNEKKLSIFLFHTFIFTPWSYFIEKRKKKTIFQNIHRGYVEELVIGTIQTHLKQDYIPFLSKLTSLDFNRCSFKSENINMRELIHLKNLTFKIDNMTVFNLPENLENIKIYCTNQSLSQEICKTIIRCIKQQKLPRLKTICIEMNGKICEMLDMISNSTIKMDKLVIFEIKDRSKYECRRLGFDLESSITLFKHPNGNTQVKFQKRNTKLELQEKDYFFI